MKALTESKDLNDYVWEVVSKDIIETTSNSTNTDDNKEFRRLLTHDDLSGESLRRSLKNENFHY